jgi:hypothetical protein
MIVDWHAHVYPPEMARERRWGGASPLTIENLLDAHEKAGSSSSPARFPAAASRS